MDQRDPAGEELVLTPEIDGRDVVFSLDEQDHERDAIYAASYGFVDRCWVFMSRPAPGTVVVRLRAKQAPTSVTALAEEFARDLMHAGLRVRLARATGELREQYVGRALFGQHEDSTIADLLAELDGEDELSIEVPWKRQSEDND